MQGHDKFQIKADKLQHQAATKLGNKHQQYLQLGMLLKRSLSEIMQYIVIELNTLNLMSL